MKNRKELRKKANIARILLLLLLLLLPINAVAKEKPKHVATMEELYDEMFNMVKDRKFSESFLVDFDPYQFNFEELMARAYANDPYIASVFPGFSMNKKQVGSQYEVTVRLPLFTGTLQEKRLRARVKAIAEELEGLSKYEQIKYAYDYIILNCEYELSKDGAYNAIIKGHACCNGYASAFYLIMEELGIPCKYTTGSNHAWNTVYLEGYWYNVDTTWGDEGGDSIDYKYFLKSNEDWTGLGPTVADAPSSYPAENLEVRYDFSDFNQKDNVKTALCIAIPVLLLFFLKATYNTLCKGRTRNRIARNEERIKNLYRLPED